MDENGVNYLDMIYDLIGRLDAIEGNVYMTRQMAEENRERIGVCENQTMYAGDVTKADFARYAENVCIGLKELFRKHFEEDNFDITEEEFMEIIMKA